jgi:hypothetical protein
MSASKAEPFRSPADRDLTVAPVAAGRRSLARRDPVPHILGMKDHAAPATRRLLSAAGLTLPLASGCLRPPPAEATPSRPSLEQRIVDDSLAALEHVRTEPGHPALDSCMRCARGVMIFPYVTSTPAHWYGGGVLLARDVLGRWSAPAFYSLGADDGSPLLGCGQSTVVLVLMSDRALRSAVDNQLSFDVPRPADHADDICQFVDVGTLYGGGSLGATTARSRNALDLDYYGPGASASAIVLERRFGDLGSAALQASLAELGRVSESAPPCGEPSRIAWEDGRGRLVTSGATDQ